MPKLHYQCAVSVYLLGLLLLLPFSWEAEYYGDDYDVTPTPDYDYNATFDYSFYSNASDGELDSFLFNSEDPTSEGTVTIEDRNQASRTMSPGSLLVLGLTALQLLRLL